MSALVPPATLGRRTVLTGALGIAGAVLVGAPSAQAAPSITGNVLKTYLAAGGAAVLGAATASVVKRRIDGHNTYAQVFEHGTVWWGSGVGKVDRPAERDRPAQRVRLAAGPNFRPVLGVTDVWRTDDLDGCGALDQRIVVDLGITTMIAMNSGHDPAIPGVKRYRYTISNAGDHLTFYRGYVTRPASRAAVGKVLSRVARSTSPVLVHCAAGKDRTGWVSDLVQAVAGVDTDVRDLDYLATRSYSGDNVDIAWLRAARAQLVSDYGTVAAYLTNGCGLSSSDLTRLVRRLG